MIELDNIDVKILAHLQSNSIVSRVAGDMRRILTIQERIDLNDVNNIRILSVKNAFTKDSTIPLSSSSIKHKANKKSSPSILCR